MGPGAQSEDNVGKWFGFLLEKARKTLFKTIALGEEGYLHFKYSRTSRDLVKWQGTGVDGKSQRGPG